MAVVVLGGLVTASLLGLFVMPALYLRFAGRRAGRAHPRGPAAAAGPAAEPSRQRRGGGTARRRRHERSTVHSGAGCSGVLVMAARRRPGRWPPAGTRRTRRAAGDDAGDRSSRSRRHRRQQRHAVRRRPRKRLGIKTAPVRARGAAAHGDPVRRRAVRRRTAARSRTRARSRASSSAPRSRVERIDGAGRSCPRGPPVGTPVVTVGSQELYGSEYEVEED